MTTDYEAFDVSLSTHLLSGAVVAAPWLWIRLGCWETAAIQHELEDVAIKQPVYIAGMARSGTTILLEFLARHNDVATHRYRDFPLGLFIPRCWSSGGSKDTSASRERVHADGLRVTVDSPEAMEEVIWMAFFSKLHDSKVSQVLGPENIHAAFDGFYTEHIRKLLFIRQRTRYISKGNYNVSRLQYLHRLFPDARFVVPIRDPRHHVASLMKQHNLFCEGEKRFPRALSHMSRIGHYEFGLNRQPINLDNSEVVEQVRLLWRQGEETRGWARYWSTLYGWLHELLQKDDRLCAATLVVRYEDLCGNPRAVLRAVFDHCRLDDVALSESFAREVKAPQYYCPHFTDGEQSAIAEETRDVARIYGYDG